MTRQRAFESQRSPTARLAPLSLSLSLGALGWTTALTGRSAFKPSTADASFEAESPQPGGTHKNKQNR